MCPSAIAAAACTRPFLLERCSATASAAFLVPVPPALKKETVASRIMLSSSASRTATSLACRSPASPILVSALITCMRTPASECCACLATSPASCWPSSPIEPMAPTAAATTLASESSRHGRSSSLYAHAFMRPKDSAAAARNSGASSCKNPTTSGACSIAAGPMAPTARMAAHATLVSSSSNRDSTYSASFTATSPMSPMAARAVHRTSGDVSTSTTLTTSGRYPRTAAPLGPNSLTCFSVPSSMSSLIA
mmetsp:Transcript_11408/g.25964  ORF Transcript_11408/g.25964 Transcript_11408/m.25964 type:complete len:251 (+) Transcript_11408:79-831(+)